eukprot:216856-Rhodomonas_salina.1
MSPHPQRATSKPTAPTSNPECTPRNQIQDGPNSAEKVASPIGLRPVKHERKALPAQGPAAPLPRAPAPADAKGKEWGRACYPLLTALRAQNAVRLEDCSLLRLQMPGSRATCVSAAAQRCEANSEGVARHPMPIPGIAMQMRKTDNTG